MVRMGDKLREQPTRTNQSILTRRECKSTASEIQNATSKWSKLRYTQTNKPLAPDQVASGLITGLVCC